MSKVELTETQKNIIQIRKRMNRRSIEEEKFNGFTKKKMWNVTVPEQEYGSGRKSPAILKNFFRRYWSFQIDIQYFRTFQGCHQYYGNERSTKAGYKERKNKSKHSTGTSHEQNRHRIAQDPADHRSAK